MRGVAAGRDERKVACVSDELDAASGCLAAFCALAALAAFYGVLLGGATLIVVTVLKWTGVL